MARGEEEGARALARGRAAVVRIANGRPTKGMRAAAATASRYSPLPVNEAARNGHTSERTGAALALTIALHLALCGYFAPPRVLFSKEPVVIADYALHFYQVDRAVSAFRGWGKLWAWDPLVLAGQPAGVAEDLTSKGTELFVIGLRALGVDSGFSINLFTALGFVLLPAAAWAAARLFDLPRRTALWVVVLWVLLWFFDSFLHWSWWIGMITWSIAAYGGVVLLGLVHRAFESRRAIWYLPIAVLAPALALIHPFIAFTLVVPGVALYARAFRRLPKTHHAWLGLGVSGAAATALVWIGPALRFRHWVETADTFFNATAEYFLFDFFDMLRNSDHTGAPVRTIVRSLCFVAGGIVLWRWHRAGDRRALPLASMVIWGVLMAYLGGYSNLSRQTQPYRQIAPAMLAAALPAAVLLRESFSLGWLRSLDASARALLGLGLVLIVPRFILTVVYYFPDLVPVPVVNPMLQNEPKQWGTRLASANHAARDVRVWLEKNHAGRGRVVIQHWVLAEYLAAATRLPLLGGIEQRNIQQGDAHLFRRAKDGGLPTAELRQYFETYAVGWVVIVGPRIGLESQYELLELVATVADHRIYRTRAEPSWFLRGTGRVVEQGLNRVTVEEASGGDVVLRFHWLESLACRPGCRVERFAVTGDRVGFIRIPSPPAAFEIYNAY